MSKLFKNILLFSSTILILLGILIFSILWKYSNDIPDYKFLKNYKNSISNLKLNINLYYKFSNKLPSKYNWYSLKDNKEFVPSFTKKILRQVSTLF